MGDKAQRLGGIQKCKDPVYQKGMGGQYLLANYFMDTVYLYCILACIPSNSFF